MATILNKPLTRETTIVRDDRNVMVTLTPDQHIQVKLKGLKSGSKKISIEKIYDQLNGISEKNDKKPITTPPKKKGIVMDINDFRSLNAISDASPSVISQVDTILAEIIRKNS